MTNEHYIDMPQPLGIFAGDLYRRSAEYLGAFEELTKGDNSDLLFASYFMLAHSIELFLKSFLAAQGVPKRTIRQLGHNLPDILNECDRLDIPQVNGLRPFVEHTFEMNKDFDFRYPSGYRLSMPRPRECLPIVRELATAVRPIVERANLTAQLRFASETAEHRGKKVRWSD